MPPFPAEGNKGKERPKKLKETPAKRMNTCLLPKALRSMLERPWRDA